MPKLTSIVALDQLLAKLTKQWQEHHDALAKIEAVFSKYGIKPTQAVAVAPEAQPVARKAVAPAGKKRSKRRRLGVSGPEFILSLLANGKVLTTAEINAEWKNANRHGLADQALATMVKSKKLKRTPIKDGKGSKYAVA